uniref:ATP-dependent DNA helicase n=1 Tax=Cajanus cajan TaxID=3821 RepID=A0A151TS93_CAJCA|nr:hypothetical protein KK1_009032 [Cajanus cajan]
MDVINNKQSQVFFMDGPGGTGKSFLYRTLIANLRSKGQIVLATVSPGIATTLLPGGQTAHSRFKISINVETDSFYSISKQSDLANLIREITAIIWDEAPMTNRYALEALDRSLKDILNCDAPFGGNTFFSHGQLYVALSRGVSQASTKILIKEGKLEGEDGNFTKNIILKQILLSQNQVLSLLIYNIYKFSLIFDNDIQKLKFVSLIFYLQSN